MGNTVSTNRMIRQASETMKPAGIVAMLLKAGYFRNSVRAARAIREALMLTEEDEARMLCDFDEGRAA